MANRPSPVLAAAVLLLLSAVLDAGLSRAPGEPAPLPSGLAPPRPAGSDAQPEGAPIWPRHAYRALVAGLVAHPDDPMELGRLERRECLRLLGELEESAYQVVWAQQRILELLSPDQAAELGRLDRDLPARALVIRSDLAPLAEEALASLGPPGPVDAPPSGWEPDPGRLRERLGSGPRGPLSQLLEGEAEATPEVAPKEVLALVARLQDDPRRALGEAAAAVAAGHVQAMARADVRLHERWQRLADLLETPARQGLVRSRMEADPEVEDLSFLEMARAFREARRALDRVGP